MATQDYKRAYIWQLPVRIFHWANALAIIVLIITGLLISHPP
ncbi:cytochrome b/b6 domain-containing protein, partial [Flavobacterium sp.]